MPGPASWGNLSVPELSQHVKTFLQSSGKDEWIAKLRHMLCEIPDSLAKKVTQKMLTDSAPVFAVWSTDESQAFARNMLQNGVQTRDDVLWKETAHLGPSQVFRLIDERVPQEVVSSTSSFSYTRTDPSGRNKMEENVSEGREHASYGTICAIAGWYLKERKASNVDVVHNTDPEGALRRKLDDDKERRTLRDAKRKREEGGPSETRKRAKHLKTPQEELDWKDGKKKAKKEKEALGIATPKRKSKAVVDKEKKALGEEIRAIPLAFYPRPQLAAVLLDWITIADELDAHVKEVLERFSDNSEKPEFEYLREKYIYFTHEKRKTHEAAGSLNTVPDLGRRLRYLDLPADVQDAVARESYANFTAAQTNFERGNNKRFDSRGREPNRRFKTLKFSSAGMAVDKGTGEVRLYPKHHYMEVGADCGVYLKDRLILFLSKKTNRLPNPKMFHYRPTKTWGSYLQCGKGVGRAFTVRYDCMRKKFSIILAFNALERGAPFRAEIVDNILANENPTAKRAKQWILRTRKLFEVCPTPGNACSLDPGFRVPWTGFDAHRRSFFDVYPDLVGVIANHHNNISLLQVWSSQRNGTPFIGPSTLSHMERRQRRARVRKERKRRKKAAGRKRRRRPRGYQHRMNLIHDRVAGIVKQAHGAFANILVTNYDTIVLPEFMTMGMVRKRRKKLSLPPIRDFSDINGAGDGPRDERPFTLHKTTRKAATYISHFTFRQRLFAKARADPNGVKDVICTTEEYTTKQCPFCTFVNHNIGGNKVFKCGDGVLNSGCGYVGPRDCTGAFNILLRSLAKGEIMMEDS